MEFLASHKHMTPFEHQTATFRVVAPVFVVREWQRHRTQSYNEMSMRYMKEYPMRFYIPAKWRKQSEKNKQGSSDEQSFDDTDNMYFSHLVREFYMKACNIYTGLKNHGVANELARICLPVGIYTEMCATANLRNWAAFWKLRADATAQWEIQQYARCIDEILAQVFPESWSVLKKHGK